MRFRLACAFFLLIFCGKPRLTAQSVGSFTKTGNMTVSRSFHTATLLHDGRVLIAGGVAQASLGTTSSAELFDPSTETFIGTGSMTTARRGHTATLLPDGRVLLAGGYGSSGPLASAELFDPSTETFAPTGDMTSAQSWHTATLLRSGKVLIAGGFYGYPAVATPQLYDPVSGNFTEAGSQPGTRYGCEWCASAALLPDGKVLLGRSQPAQLYDPVADAFQLAGEMVDSDRFTATTLADGKVLFTGGSWTGRSSTSELYDPGSDSFQPSALMADRRGWHTATLLPDGTTLIVGGETESCSSNFCSFAGSLDSAEVYEPKQNTFIATGRMAVRRGVHTATLLNDGRVLVAGGVSYGGIGVFYGGQTGAELYHPQVLIPAPRLLTVLGDAGRQGTILHGGTERVVTEADPANPGEILEVYLTGLMDGSVLPPTIVIGGRTAEVLLFGNSPSIEGVNLLHVRVPDGVAPGPEVGVRLMYLERTSNEVTIGVRGSEEDSPVFGRGLYTPRSDAVEGATTRRQSRLRSLLERSR